MRFQRLPGRFASRPGARVLRMGAGAALLAALAVLAGTAEPAGPAAAAADDVPAPYRMIVYLEVAFPDARGICSGFLVGPHTVATAGHCVYDRGHGGWATSVAVTPGVDGIVAPFARQVARSFSVAPEYLQTGDPVFDYGAITLDSDVLGMAVGQFELAVEPDRQLRVGRYETAGYGASVMRATQWRMASPRPLLEFDERSLVYEWGTVPGMSGAPIFERVEGAHRAFGMVAGESASAQARTFEVGVRVNERMLAFYRAVAREPLPARADPPVGVAFRTTSGRTILVRSTTSAARSVPVVLQNSQDRVRWRTVASGTTDAAGASAFQIEPTQTMYYRLVALGVGPGPVAQGVVAVPSVVYAASRIASGDARDAAAPRAPGIGTAVPVKSMPAVAGGSLAGLAAAVADTGASAAWLRDATGAWHLYILGGAAFVNEGALRAFPAGSPPATPVLVVGS